MHSCMRGNDTKQNPCVVLKGLQFTGQLQESHSQQQGMKWYVMVGWRRKGMHCLLYFPSENRAQEIQMPHYVCMTVNDRGATAGRAQDDRPLALLLPSQVCLGFTRKGRQRTYPSLLSLPQVLMKLLESQCHGFG